MTNTLQQERILRIKEVTYRTGLPRPTVYDHIKKGLFPKQISLGGGKSVGWVESQVQAWINDRIKQGTK